MHHTRIVTSFLTNDERFLILKRSQNVKSMKGLWGGVSGVIEENEEPLRRAKIEIFEEVGIEERQIDLLKTATELQVRSEQYSNHEWTIFPFLFNVKEPKIRLNWENSDYKWISPDEISRYKTVPNLDEVLARLL
ncbi:MAG TPA: NUDIX domain-containing protein [Nitrosopumilaceae archaeon]|nr:NUDIX domain-containing protein [Nitrosopumilaceae archaeon]